MALRAAEFRPLPLFSIHDAPAMHTTASRIVVIRLGVNIASRCRVVCTKIASESLEGLQQRKHHWDMG